MLNKTLSRIKILSKWKIKKLTHFYHKFITGLIAQKFSKRTLSLTCCVLFFTASTTQAIVNGERVKLDQWRSVAYLQLINPDTSILTNCTAVIISERFAITSASCVIHEETGKQVTSLKVCIGNKKPFKGAGQHCFSSNKIYSHHHYLNSSTPDAAFNLAYIEFKAPIDLKKYQITPASLITPDEFSDLARDDQFPEITWVGFDAKNLRSPSLGTKYKGVVKDVEFNYQHQTIEVESNKIRLGRNYQGMASFVEIAAGQWRLLGLVSNSHPDNIIRYFPEFNPCDEDPIPVHYPAPNLQTTSVLTAYPVAACEMQGFVESTGFDASSCTRLKRNLNWETAVDSERPTALRHKAIALYNSNQSHNEAGEIYKMLYMAYSEGDNKAALKLAEFLIAGELFDKDIETAKQLIEELVAQNNPHAHLIRAKLQLFPDGQNEIIASTPDIDRAIYQDLKIAAEDGISEAQHLIGRLTQLEIGLDGNSKKSRTVRHREAYNWHALAAMQGHGASQFQLAMFWIDGRGMRAYPEVGQFWIDQSAALGNINAQNYLGMLKP